MDIKIGSLNLCKMNYQSNKDISKDYQKIADVICGTQFDILAVQETLNEGAIKHLVSKLSGGNWDYRWDSPVSKSKQAAEGYAFIWNANRFRLATDTKKDEHYSPKKRIPRTFQTRIQSNYRGLQQESPGLNGRLIRDPLYTRFESINGWYEIRLINTHIVFSSSSYSERGFVSPGDRSVRNREFDILVDIYRQLSDKVYRSARPHYTILLGDYNLNLDRAWTNRPYLRNEFIELDNGKKGILTTQASLSTLKSRSPKTPDTPATGFANNYDHFTFDCYRFHEGDVIWKADIVDSVSTYWQGDFDRHRREMSDHVPIILEMNLRGE